MIIEKQYHHHRHNNSNNMIVTHYSIYLPTFSSIMHIPNTSEWSYRVIFEGHLIACMNKYTKINELDLLDTCN